MPTLHWIGKDKVINHHMDVPFKVLEHSYGFDNGTQTEQETNSGNKIIHGDNLEALKALLPEYEGKVKCIYIDPPYNTGNESWVYNDNVNDPKIKKWLGQVVGKEAEDLTRHDKWLCMMYPRLKLLHKLLSDDGAIFISIDDNEQANLKLICDEIFGGGNFVANITAQTNPRGRTLDKHIAKTNEFILVYTKSKSKEAIFQIPKDEKAEGDYKNIDEFGKYRFLELRNRNPVFSRQNRPNLYYPIYVNENGNISLTQTEEFKTEVLPLNSKNEEGCWTWGKDKSNENKNLLVGKKVNTGAWRIHRKDYFEGTSLLTKSKSIWLETNINHENGKELLGEIFGKTPFDFPKSVSLIERCLLIGSQSYSNHLILDCFAGSGTTAHAVLNLNKQDSGNRKFICIEMEDYAETITAERVKRVIKGYGTTEGTGGSFDFYELGQPLFLENGNLNENIGIEKIRQYVYYTETQATLTEDKHKDNEYFLGKHNDTAYYFHYEQDEVTTLNHAFLATMQTQAEQYVIYADNCLLTKDFMTKHHIIFKKIPRDITRF
jgi:adenine-specific DNA-methyltransferase